MVISILSYCDTLLKKNQLRDLIISVKKKFPSDQILVYSHYQNLEPEYYELADFYLFDKSNPKSPKIFTDWIFVEPQGKKFHRDSVDWGFAVMQMIKRTLLFLKSMNYKEVLFLNYDCSPDDIGNLNLSEKKSKLKNYHVGIFSKWGHGSGLSMTQFFIKIDRLNTNFFDLINMEHYCSFDGSIIPEVIWLEILTDSFGQNFLIDEFGIHLNHSLTQRCLPDDSYLQKYFNTILPTRDSITNEKCLAIWNANLLLESIVLEINGKLQKYTNDIPYMFRNHSFFCKLGYDGINEIKLVSINDTDLDTSYVMDNLSEIYWKSNYHSFI